MFGFDDAESLRDTITRMQSEHANRVDCFTDRIGRMQDLLGDLFAMIPYSHTTPFVWEGSQTEYHAKGFEDALMGQAKAARDVCRNVRERLEVGMRALCIDPKAVGEEAQRKRVAAEKLRRVEQLRAEATRLETEVIKG